MNRYLIEREIPGASELTLEALRGITSTSNEAVEHANAGGFPANLVSEVASVFDSTGPRGMPS